ncbi:hypothetical protein LTR46_011245 [Exophiala xenobiotica]|nr:hypothetical protein LTR46_011245 [Exophiala xenobiotica]
MTEIRPFAIDVPEEEIARLKNRLQDTRLPSDPIVPEAGSPPIEWFHRLYNSSLHDFDWSTVQQHLSRHWHFVTAIEDKGRQLRVHFTHSKSSRSDASPLILVYGWPGSFYVFDRVLHALVHLNDTADPAFNVVVPSLPASAGRPAPPGAGTLQGTARVFNKLNANLGSKFPECKAVHLNFCPVPLPDDLPSLTPREQKVKQRYHDWQNSHLGYAVTMRSRPHTISVALNDNPVGTLAGEKYQEAVASVKLDDAHWDEGILVTCSLYFSGGYLMTSQWLYNENVEHAETADFFCVQRTIFESPLGILRSRTIRGRTPNGQSSLQADWYTTEKSTMPAILRQSSDPTSFLSSADTLFGEWYKS